MPIIYHVTTAAEWNAAKANGYYETPSLKEEGFIEDFEEVTAEEAKKCVLRLKLKYVGVIKRKYYRRSMYVLVCRMAHWFRFALPCRF